MLFTRAIPARAESAVPVLRPQAAANRGASLAFVLVVTALGFLAAFVLAGTSSAHMGFANRVSQDQRARNLAEAAIAEALAHLQEDPSYGQAQETVTVTLPGLPPGAGGTVSFQTVAPDPFSTYNLQSETARPGFRGRTVPAHSVHLVGVGTCGTSERMIEVIATLPPYPYAIASAGPIESDGELLVGAVNNLSETTVWTPEDLLPAHLASNDPNETSIVLGPLTTVVGDVRSVGGLNLEAGAVVKGQTLAYVEPVALPELPLSEYDPALQGSGYQELPPVLSDTTIVGTARSSEDLNIFGDLTLDNSKLFVDGHLRVQGRILGQGLVVAKHGATIANGARISGGQAVLLSGGDVSLRGGGPMGSFFQGLVYAEGEFEARDITVVGSFISRGENARVRLKNARVLGDPQQSVYQPSQGGNFHFVPTGEAHRPAEQVDSPIAGSFTIRVEVQAQHQNGNLIFSITHPITGEVSTSQNLQSAAVAITTMANDIARESNPTTTTGPAKQKNLVATSKTLHESLQDLVTAQESGSQDGFDLNRFLSVAERMRVTLWREL